MAQTTNLDSQPSIRHFMFKETTCAADAVAVAGGSNTTVYDPPLRGLYIGTTGNVTIVTPLGTQVTFASVPVGFFPVNCQQVLSTGTTASNIVGLR